MSIPNSYSQGSIGGGNSPSGDVKFTYLGFQQTKNSQSLLTKVTFQGTRQELIYRRDLPQVSGGQWYIGKWDSEYGRLQSVDINQDAGPFWHATLNYNYALNNGITVNFGEDGEAQQSSLDISMISMPIEKALLYDYRWNHTLIATTSSTTVPTAGDQHTAPVGFTQLNNLLASLSIPFSARWTEATAMRIYNAGKSGKYAKSLDLQWVDDPNVTPSRGLSDYTEKNTLGKSIYKNLPWRVVYYPEKPGVDHFDYPVYTITESGKYTSRLSCAWAIKKGGVLAFPDLGDYGIQMYYHPDLNSATSASTPSCYWLCDGGQIEFDGKYYNATCKYTYSWEPTGWDQQLYGIYKSWNQYLTQSKNNANTYTGNVVKSSNSSDILHPIFNNQGNISNPIGV